MDVQYRKKDVKQYFPNNQNNLLALLISITDLFTSFCIIKQKTSISLKSENVHTIKELTGNLFSFARSLPAPTCRKSLARRRPFARMEGADSSINGR